jgi:hypothetical protein
MFSISILISRQNNDNNNNSTLRTSGKITLHPFYLLWWHTYYLYNVKYIFDVSKKKEILKKLSLLLNIHMWKRSFRLLIILSDCRTHIYTYIIPKTNTIIIIPWCHRSLRATASMSSCEYKRQIHIHTFFSRFLFSLGKLCEEIAAFTFEWMNVGFAPLVPLRKRHAKEGSICVCVNARRIHIYFRAK